jgi:hypothetical protein
MDLVDRYVAAVKRHLPATMQDDIVNELTDDILSQIRDKEDALGRPLGESEQEALLKQYGHPYLLARRYRPQQSLIGPTLFPFYFPDLTHHHGQGVRRHLSVGSLVHQVVKEVAYDDGSDDSSATSSGRCRSTAMTKDSIASDSNDGQATWTRLRPPFFAV